MVVGVLGSGRYGRYFSAEERLTGGVLCVKQYGEQEARKGREASEEKEGSDEMTPRKAAGILLFLIAAAALVIYVLIVVL